ncbi:hypothetical protein VKT23_017708 [Stygiomarasmius scandens]|uniref:Uncharacterized protein n=1 Tax=Marasmiellus scandens TaxID=2682957 RepID=A0ABR1ITH7_9AGAR
MSAFLGLSIARPASENDEDWYQYYVGIFADRDMVVRFCPTLGFGHHRAAAQHPEEPSAAFQEDGNPDADVLPDAGQLVPEHPPEVEDKECDEETLDEQKAEEWLDFGYGEEEEEDKVVEGNELEGDNADIGPEDGEDPVNHNMEVLDQEGYGML